MLSLKTFALLVLFVAQATKTGPALRNVHRTVYSNKTELYAEFLPLIVGQPTRLTAHLTKIDGDRFQAYTEGTITMTLNVAGTPLEVVVQGPERAGVFRLPTTPAKAGPAKMTLVITEGAASETFLTDDVTVYPDTQAALAAQPPDETAGLVKYSKENAWDQNFATAQIHKSGAALTVPRSAIIQDGDVSRIYVQRTPEAYELREVKTGNTRNQSVEIVQGLKEGERIVIKGVEKMPLK